MFKKTFKFSWNLFKFIAVVGGSVVASKVAWKGLKNSFGILADELDDRMNQIKEA